jgi:hypothetical protein
MNNNLRNLQADIKIALDDYQVTPGQIVEVFRETLKSEASRAQDSLTKANEALELLENDFTESITFSSFAADSVNMNYFASGSDVLTF